MNLLEKKTSPQNFQKEWEFISDQVMGGISSGKLDLINSQEESFIRLSGTVSTENNGGFIQYRSDYKLDNENFKYLEPTKIASYSKDIKHKVIYCSIET